MALPLAIHTERQGQIVRRVTLARPAAAISPPPRLSRNPGVGEAAAQAERLERLLKTRLAELSDRSVGSAVELIGDIGGLFPGEDELVANAGPSRLKEFRAGRCCARRALAALGLQPVSIPMGPVHEPIWPLGCFGSISHDGRFAAALAYRSGAAHGSISLDLVDFADPHAFAGIADTILHPAEPRRSDPRGIARLFSAKEAAIKLVSPAVGDFVDFRQVRATETDFGFRLVGEGMAVDVRTYELDGLIVSLGSSLR
jgi:4'-phosphopantetheinyl transferase EntD